MRIMSEQLDELLPEQLAVWELAGKNYKALEDVKTKEFCFGDYSVRLQFNPARIQSAAAKVDTKSIQERKCFLCSENLPVIQKGIPYGDHYQILVNPFPIFPKHFTIPTLAHLEQSIAGRYGDMLDLAKDLQEYTIFYNGPRSGASAPDHMHFQAGNKGFLPVEEDVKKVSKTVIYSSGLLQFSGLDSYLRSCFLIQGGDKEALIELFHRVYQLADKKEGETEAMMNVITWYEEEQWYSCVFLREKHRPSDYYKTGKDQLLISPGAVDMGGVLIIAREEDFEKITSGDVERILPELSLDDNQMDVLIKRIQNVLRSDVRMMDVRISRSEPCKDQVLQNRNK